MCAVVGAVFGVLAQGLVSRTGSGGGSTGELAAAVTVTLGGGKAGTAPLTTAADRTCRLETEPDTSKLSANT